MERRWVVLLVVLTAFAVGAPLANAAAWGVDDTTDTPLGQACSGFTHCSLREALTSTEANPGPDAILISAGTYPLTNGELTVTQDLTVARVGAGSATISGSNASRIFEVNGSGADLVLRFLTVTDGYVADPSVAQGGAIYGDLDTTISIESSTISNSTVTSPDSAEGGGIWSEGMVTIGNAAGSTTGSVIGGNLAQTTDNGSACGGGIAVVDGDGLTVGAGTTITANQATAPNGFLGHGGGVWFASDGRQATFTEATVSGNTASGVAALGGGVDLEAGTASFVRSTISGNSVTSAADSGLAFGGGIAVTDDATLDLTFSTVAGNTATSTGLGGGALGGGVASSFYGPAGALSATGSTIAANSVSSSCGCVAGAGFFDGLGEAFTLAGTILAGNTGTGQAQCDDATIASGGYDVLGPLGSCGYAAGPGDKTGVKSPKLKPLGNYGGPTETMMLQAGSPALDVIPTADTLCTNESTDQRDVSRPLNGDCDAGAVEARPATIVITGDPVAFPHTLPSAFSTDSVTVDNTGELDAARPTITLGAPFSATGCTGAIAAGDSCTMDLKFAPTQGGGFSTKLNVRSGLAHDKATVSGVGWAPTVGPAIGGTPTVGWPTRVDTGRWPASVATFSLQWQRCDGDGNGCADIPGTHVMVTPALLGSTRVGYTPVRADWNHRLRVRLTARSTTGVESDELTTAPSAVVSRTVPALLQGPYIERASSPVVGLSLFANHGQWTDAESYTYQWILCDADGTSNCDSIPGKTSNRYTPVAADAGHVLRIRVVAKNPIGSTAHAGLSAPSGVVSS